MLCQNPALCHIAGCWAVELHGISQNITLFHYTDNIMLIAPSEHEVARTLAALGVCCIGEVSSLVILSSYLGLTKTFYFKV